MSTVAPSVNNFKYFLSTEHNWIQNICKKEEEMLFSLFFIIRNPHFDQTTLVHKVSESRWSTLSNMEKENSGVQFKVVVFFLNVGKLVRLFYKVVIKYYPFISHVFLWIGT